MLCIRLKYLHVRSRIKKRKKSSFLMPFVLKRRQSKLLNKSLNVSFRLNSCVTFVSVWGMFNTSGVFVFISVRTLDSAGSLDSAGFHLCIVRSQLDYCAFVWPSVSFLSWIICNVETLTCKLRLQRGATRGSRERCSSWTDHWGILNQPDLHVSIVQLCSRNLQYLIYSETKVVHV